MAQTEIVSKCSVAGLVGQHVGKQQRYKDRRLSVTPVLFVLQYFSKNTLNVKMYWSQQYAGHNNALNVKIYWSQQCTGYNNTLNVKIYWSQQYTGYNNALNVKIYWSQQYTGYNNTLNVTIQ